MKQGLKLIWIGVFILVALALIVWLLLFLRPRYGNGEKELHVRFTNVERIEDGTLVTYGGRPVGEVTNIEYVPNAREGRTDKFGNFYLFELRLKVDSCVDVYTYDEVLFSTAGLLGEKSISILPKSTPAGSPPAKDISNEIIYARSTGSLQDAIDKLMKIGDSVETTFGHLDRFFEDNKEEFHDALISVRHGADALGVFMRDANDVKLPEHIANAAAAVTDIADKVRSGQGTIASSSIAMRFIIRPHL